MQQHNYDFKLKIVVIGNCGVGKTTLLSNYIGEDFNLPGSSVSVDFRMVPIEVDEFVIKLMLWDTQGQERYRIISQQYFRGANGILLMYSIEDEKSFEQLNNWIKQIEDIKESEFTLILVGNKNDLQNVRKVQYQQGCELSKKLGIGFIECSGKSGENVKQMFQELCCEILKKYRQKNALKLWSEPERKVKQGCC